MPLRDYVVPSHTIMLDAKNSFTVRGISFTDLTALAAQHAPSLVIAYNSFVEARAAHGTRPESIGQIIHQVAAEFPDIVHSIIALASGEPGTEKIVADLPAGIQAEALERTVALTFAGEADIKKFVETITRMFQGVVMASEKLTAPLTTTDSGSGAFVSN